MFIAKGQIGQVIETDEETQYIIYVDSNPESIFYAHFIKDNPHYPESRLLENDYIEFKGASLGLINYDTAGNTIKTVPEITIHQIINQ